MFDKIIPEYKEMNFVFQYEDTVEKGNGCAACKDLMIFAILIQLL